MTRYSLVIVSFSASRSYGVIFARLPTRADHRWFRLPPVRLSITHISGRSDFCAEFDIGKSQEAAPDDDVSRRGSPVLPDSRPIVRA